MRHMRQNIIGKNCYISGFLLNEWQSDRRTRTPGQLWKRRTVMEKTNSYGKDGHKAFETIFLKKRRTQY